MSYNASSNVEIGDNGGRVYALRHTSVERLCATQRVCSNNILPGKLFGSIRQNVKDSDRTEIISGGRMTF